MASGASTAAAAGTKGPANSVATGDSQFVVINSSAFSGGFSGASLLAFLAKDALKQKYGQARNLEGGMAPAAAKASLEKVQKLVQTLDKAEVELLQLHREVSKKVSYLQVTFSQQESKYKAEVDSVLANTGAVSDSFSKLEGCMNRVSQIGTRIGDRLQTADSLRTRALQLVEVMGYLRQFSELDEDSSDFKRTLPPVFWEDGGLHEAAVLTRRLMSLVVDAMSAKQRSKLLQVADEVQDYSAVKGSLDYTHARLQQYSGWLEARMVARFDRALEKDDLETMAECTMVMTEFGRGKTITQRYVSTHPMLMLSEEEALAPFPGRPKGHTKDELRMSLIPLDELFEELLKEVQEEAGRMTYIFPEPRPAMELLVQRMFEERVKSVVDRLLGRDAATPRSSVTPMSSLADDDDASSSMDDQHSSSMRHQLVVTTEVYLRTRAFMEAVQEAAVPPLGPLDLGLARDTLFGEFLAVYPQPELDYLLAKFHEETETRQVELQRPPPPPAAPPARNAPAPPPPPPLLVLEVSAPLADLLVACHGEALQRAQLLAASEQQLAKCVRQIFHGEGPFATMQGSLLQLLAQLVLDGVEHSLDVCDIRNFRAQVKSEVEGTFNARQLLRQQLMIARYEAFMEEEPLPEAPKLRDVDRATAMGIGQAFVGHRILPILEAANQSSAIMTRLQQHYSEEVAPLLAGSISDLSACSSGLLALIRAAEEGVLFVLRSAADVMVIQVEKLLMLEQRAAEFLLRAQDVEGASFTRPTNACRMVCSHLSALHGEALRQLDGNNLASFMSEVGSRVHAVFLNHIQQFVYSPHGALRLKADVNEYTECIKAMDLPALLEKFSATQVLANVLVVAPDALLALVNGTLRIPHREALKYIRLREDFESALVDGKSLQQLFMQSSTDPAVMAVSGAAAGAKR